MNAEMFARGKDNIESLLALLQDQADFYIRYYTVQLLTALAHSSIHKVVQVDKSYLYWYIRAIQGLLVPSLTLESLSKCLADSRRWDPLRYRSKELCYGIEDRRD